MQSTTCDHRWDEGKCLYCNYDTAWKYTCKVCKETKTEITPNKFMRTTSVATDVKCTAVGYLGT